MITKWNVGLLETVVGRLGLLAAGCFALSGHGERWVGHGVHPRFKGVTCVMTLGNDSDRVFLTMTDADPSRIGRILAAIEFYGRPGAHELAVSDSMPLTDTFALDNGRVAAMLMAPDVFPGGKELLQGFDVEGRHCNVVGVIFLDAEEYAVRRQDGAVALIERFEKRNRDCISFNAEEAAG
jgi:hypothetical protein